MTRKDVKMFREDLEKAVTLALESKPPIVKGEWCRFAPCKIACPLWTGPITGLADLIEIRPTPADAAAPEYTAYGNYLAKAKTLLDVAAKLKKEIDDQMHTFLEAGGQIPGWRLKPENKNAAVDRRRHRARELRNLGFTPQEICRKNCRLFRLLTPPHESEASRSLIIYASHRETNETTIAPTNDPAPVVDRRLGHRRVLESFKAIAR